MRRRWKFYLLVLYLTFSLSLQIKNEIGEKYESCGNAIDGLLGKLRGNRQELSRRLLGGIREEDAVDGSSSSGGRNFKDGILFVRERESFHRKLDAEVKEHLKTADQLSSAEGAAVLSPEEFHNLRKRSDALKNEYNDDSVRLETVLDRLTAASKLKDQFDTNAVAFRKWMERTHGSLDRMLTLTTNSSTIVSCQKQCRELNDDVSGHRSELDAITTLARKIQDEVKGYATQLTEDKSIVANVPAWTTVKMESDGLVSAWQGLKDRCQLSHHQIEDAKNFFILYGQLKSWLYFKWKFVAIMDPVGVDTRLIDNQQQQIQVLLDEFEGQKPIMDEFVRCGNSHLAAQTSQETKQPISEKIGEIRNNWTILINRLNEKKSGLSAEIDLAAKFRRERSETSRMQADLRVLCGSFWLVGNKSDSKEEEVSEGLYIASCVGVGICLIFQVFFAVTSYGFGSFSVVDLQDHSAKLASNSPLKAKIRRILWFIEWPISTPITLGSADLIVTGCLIYAMDNTLGVSSLSAAAKLITSIVFGLGFNGLFCKLLPAALQIKFRIGISVTYVCSLILMVIQVFNIWFWIGWIVECIIRERCPMEVERRSSRDLVTKAVRMVCGSDKSDCGQHPIGFGVQRVLMVLYD